MAKKGKPSFIRRGREAVEKAIANSGETFLKLKDGDSVEIAVIGGVDDIISFDQHSFWIDEGDSPIFPCLQDDTCPGCMLGDNPQFKAIITVMIKEDSGMSERLMIFGKSVLRSLVDAEDAIGESLHGKILRYSRKGSKLQTRYSLIPTGRSVKVPELNKVELNPIDYIGITDRDEIIEALRSKNLWEFDKSPKGRKKSEPDSIDEDDSDWESEDFEDFEDEE